MTSHQVAPASRNQERVVAEFRARNGKVGGYQAQTTRKIPVVILTRR